MAKAAAASGAATVPLTSTRTGSVIFGAGNDWDGAAARTLSAGQSMVHEFVDMSVGDTFWVQKTSTPTTVRQAVAVGTTSPSNHQWNMAAVEVIPALTGLPVVAETVRYSFNGPGKVAP